jgi:hypothetical protein
VGVSIQFKGIKPQKMNIKAIRDELLKELELEGEDTVEMFERTTRTWTHKPEFEVLTDLAGDGAAILVGTDDEIYGYVDKGTRPHVIAARRAPMLRFPSSFVSKTTPGIIGSRGGRSAGPMRYAKAVLHPGTEPRNFSETIQKARKKTFQRRMLGAMQRGSQVVWK